MRATILLGGLGVFLFGGCILLDDYNYGEGGAGGGGQGGAASSASVGAGGDGGSIGVGGDGGAGGALVPECVGGLVGMGGSSPSWSRRFGDAKPQTARSVAVATDGSVYVTGSFSGQFAFGSNSSANGQVLTCDDAECPFLMRLDSQGTPSWVKTLGRGQPIGSSMSGKGTAVVTVGDDVIWAGYMPSNPKDASSPNDVFVQRVKADCTPTVTRIFKEAGDHQINAMVYDPTGNGTLFLAGAMESELETKSPFPCSNTSQDIDTAGLHSLFVFAVDAANLACGWGAAYGGGNHPAESISIAAKHGERLYVSGTYTGGVAGATNLPINEGAFLVQIDLGGTHGITNSRGFTGASGSAGSFASIRVLQVAPDGNLYVAGSIAGSVIDGTASSFYNGPADAGKGDAVVASFNPTLATNWVHAFGGEDTQVATSLALRGPELFLTGMTDNQMSPTPDMPAGVDGKFCANGRKCFFYFRLGLNGMILVDGDAAVYRNPDMSEPSGMPVLSSPFIAVNADSRAIAAGAGGPVMMKVGMDDKADETNADNELDLIIGHWSAPIPPQ